ncbi:MAG: hypothetical protein ACYTG3_19555 [Planctomycetota bacterium]
MRILGSIALLLGLTPGGSLAQGQSRDVTWERDLNATLARARAENRPILIAINALDTERGNQAQRTRAFRDPALVAATRPMLCLVANPNDHDRGGTCARYGSSDCKTHRDVLTYALRRWSKQGDIISPQHMILAPDGTLLWRQEFYIEPGPLKVQCERALVKTAPDLALELAGRTRQEALRSLEGGGLDPKAYLKRGDPLAPAVLLLAWEGDQDPKWLEALKRVPDDLSAGARSAKADAFGLVRLYLEDEPVYLDVAKAIDSKRGAWWRQRLTGKPTPAPPPHSPKLRRAFLALKKGDTSGLDKLLAALDHPVDGPEVRAALAELAGADHGPDPAGWKEQFAK